MSQVLGYLKRKRAIDIARVYGERMRNFVGRHFSPRDYFASTGGRDKQVSRGNIRDQEREDQLDLWS